MGTSFVIGLTTRSRTFGERTLVSLPLLFVTYSHLPRSNSVGAEGLGLNRGQCFPGRYRFHLTDLHYYDEANANPP